MAKHRNYEILNLIGYALAKFDNDFIKEFGFSTKNAFLNIVSKSAWLTRLALSKIAWIYLIIFFLTNAKVGGKKAMPISIENYGLIVCLEMKALRVLAIL
ncbi:hypothetical protein ID0507_03170 [Helicobacter pylori]